MKKSVAVLCFSVWCLVAYGQVPTFAFDSARWVVYSTLPFETRTVYTTGTDTLIGSYLYTTIWTDFYDGSFSDTNNLELFIRGDSGNRVLYRYPLSVSSDTNEYVLYDYSLSPGDTFFMNGPLFLGPDTFVVASSLSWQLYNGDTVNEIDFLVNSQGCFFGQFVEMVGNVGHPFYPLVGLPTFPDTCLPHVECYQVANVELYGSNNGCDVNTNIYEQDSNICSSVAIDQQSNIVTITSSCHDKMSAELIIYDLLGRELQRSIIFDRSYLIPLDFNGPILIVILWDDHAEKHLIPNIH